MRFKIIAWILILSNLFFVTGVIAVGEKQIPVSLLTPSAILMEQTTGQILYEKDSHKKMPPASVTKIMTLLLTIEAIESGKISLDDIVICSEKVSKMEGSKVFLSKGEKISIRDLLKSIAVASGNDAAVAVAEFLCGSEDGFVTLMNQRAQELGMVDTHFANCTGLDNPQHLTTAYDIGIMSRELLKHEQIFDYTTIWIDSLRDGKFQLANTNKLIRFYEGANGLKTGSTSISKYCLSATAKRNDMQLIAVMLGAPTSTDRFEEAKGLLDYGFANYAVIHKKGTQENLGQISVLKGKQNMVKIGPKGGFDCIIEKGTEGKIKENISMAPDLMAPIEKDQTVGEITYRMGDKELGKVKIVTVEAVEEITIPYQFFEMLARLLMIQ